MIAFMLILALSGGPDFRCDTLKIPTGRTQDIHVPVYSFDSTVLAVMNIRPHREEIWYIKCRELIGTERVEDGLEADTTGYNVYTVDGELIAKAAWKKPKYKTVPRWGPWYTAIETHWVEEK